MFGIKEFIERGRKGYTRRDLWNFDEWLSKLIANGLRELRKNCHGYPNDIDNWEDWMKVLDEMIECFEEQNRRIDNIDKDFLNTFNKRAENKKAKLHRGLELLERYYFDFWD